MGINLKGFTNLVKKGLEVNPITGIGKAVQRYQQYKGYAKRQSMVDQQVARNVTKKYGGGRPVSSNPGNIDLYKNEKKELEKKLKSKNSKLLDY
jgi:hypothetical protein